MTRTLIVCANVAMLTMTTHVTLVQAQSTQRDSSSATTAATEKKQEKNEEKKQGDGGSGGNGPSLKGRGTQGRVATWLDSRTLGDSVIAEIDGLLGIGTITPESKVTVVDDASFKAVLRVTNVGTSGVAVQADGSDQTIDVGGEGLAATGGDSPVGPGDGILASGGVSEFVRGGNGIVTFGGGSGVEGGAGIVALGGGSAVRGGAGIRATGGLSGGPGHISGDGIVASPGQAFPGATPGRAGVFNGNVDVTGTLTKAGGSFRIDHPLDPANRYLSHSFVESPDMMNVYNGNITTNDQGLAIVELPGWFESLNKDFRYQLTVIGTFAQAMVAEKIAGNHFAIRTSTPHVEVSWQVTGIRRDAWAETHRIPVDEEKPAEERGHYLHPDLYGQPAEKSLESLRHPELRQPQPQPAVALPAVGTDPPSPVM